MIKNTDVENNLTVINPEITEVIDKISGAILPVKEIIGSDYDKVIKLRVELLTFIKRNEPRYICPLCHTPVYLVCRHKTRHFFCRHTIDDGRCTVDTRGNMSEAEINARKYNGAKESEAHKQMKKIIAESLKADGRFKDIAIEQVWKSQEHGEWKKPDVYAIFDDRIRIVFEIQLSTTFLRVIVERKEFYLKEGGLLCWIFKEIKEEYPRLMQDDIFYNNNCNLFLASEETLHVSNKQKRLFLKCCWFEPVIENQEIVNTWKNEIVPFDQLTFDHEQQRIFFFDYDCEKHKLTQQLARERFEQFWLSNNSNLDLDEISQELQELIDFFSKHNILLFTQYDLHNDGLTSLLNALYSAKYGKPIGYKFRKLIQIAHQMENGHKKYLKIFGWALRIYGRDEQIKREDSSGKWANKVDKFRPLMQSNDEKYQHDGSFDQFISFLFPELAERLGKL
ncbi:hypothetical protein THIOM_004443 [Candidatus Thiomargarita nelsonii]|uniref:Competence protein n=1 Tax=Candidatus Thiomargarita nelsonii TaxID=1003181 RepID=A0A176RVU9_9GAMM|nr:hypothetical protein THIOM_004443 [Candidatus Thiomargarita nelsonii]